MERRPSLTGNNSIKRFTPVTQIIAISALPAGNGPLPSKYIKYPRAGQARIATITATYNRLSTTVSIPPGVEAIFMGLSSLKFGNNAPIPIPSPVNAAPIRKVPTVVRVIIAEVTFNTRLVNHTIISHNPMNTTNARKNFSQNNRLTDTGEDRTFQKLLPSKLING